jgi:hypothetical protein
MIQRKKPLKRSTKPLKRTPVRTRRTKPRRRAGACRPYLDWLKLQPCCITGMRSDASGYGVDPAHIKTRGSGGDDLYNAVPLIRRLHDIQHQMGWPEFEKWYGIGAKALAQEYTEEFLTLYPQYRESA